MRYAKFQIGELFEKLEIRPKKAVNKRDDVSKTPTTEFSLPLVNAKEGDNGIMFWGRPGDFDFAEMTICVVSNGAIATGNVYAEPQPTGVLWDAYLIALKNYSFPTRQILLYFATVLKKAIKHKYNYDNKAVWSKVEKDYITLPTTDQGEVDYALMHRYIAKLEDEHTSKLNMYLKLVGLDDYVLTADEQAALARMQTHTGVWRDFKIGDGQLFEVTSPAVKFNANAVTVHTERIPGGYRYVARTAGNNGVRGYIVADQKYLSPANTISFGQDTATIFFQDEDYFTGDKIKVMRFLPCELSPRIATYLITNMRNAFSNFVWGQSSFNQQILESVDITLPVTDNDELDCAFMETYIRAEEKIAIQKAISRKSKGATKATKTM